MIFHKEDLQTNEVYKLLSGSVIPRPIAWVSTVSEKGIPNLAPFSFFTVASWNPPTLCFSVGPGVQSERIGEKDTLANIRKTGEFVVNVVSLPLAGNMHISSGNYSPDIDEFIESGVTATTSHFVSAPSVQEAPISMECKLDKIVEVGKNHLVLGQMVCYRIKDEYYLGNFKVDIAKIQPIGRLAGSYTFINTEFVIPSGKK